MTAAPALPLTPINAAMQAALLVDDQPRTEVFLVRHGQQQYADDSTPRARALDPPLSERGRQQAELLGKHLADAGLSAVYSSHMLRARETAQSVSAPVHEPVDDVHEVQIFRSVAAGASVNDAVTAAELATMGDAFKRTRSFDAFTTGEPSSDVRRRARRQIEHLASEHLNARIAVVLHAGVLNAFLADVFGISADMVFFPAHASISRVYLRGDTWAIASLNETAHLLDQVTF